MGRGFQGQAAIEEFFTQYNTELEMAFNDPTAAMEIAMFNPTQEAHVESAGLLSLPAIEEWLSTPKVNTLATVNYSVTLKRWKMLYAISKFHLSTDKHGIFTNHTKMLAVRTRRFIEERITQALTAGLTELCYDGTAFFNTAHPSVSGEGVSQSNLTSGGGSPTWYLLDLNQGMKPIVWNYHSDYSNLGFKTEIVSDADSREYKVNGNAEFQAEGFAVESYGAWQLARASTLAPGAANFNAEYEAMMGTKDDRGKAIGIVPSHLVCPTSQRYEWMQVLKASNAASGATNVNEGDVQLIVSPYI